MVNRLFSVALSQATYGMGSEKFEGEDCGHSAGPRQGMKCLDDVACLSDQNCQQTV